MKESKISPLVAIHCLVYNHEPYLRDCFEGFIMQQTNFPFVAIVHDDASIDGSATIVREYEQKYPHIFKPIYEIENQFSKRDGSLERIMNKMIDDTGAKYVAMCEGDDYWIDPYKLQKQVDFLEKNPRYSICFHKTKTLIHHSNELKDEFLVREMLGESTICDLASNNYIHTPSVVFKRGMLDFGLLEHILPCMPLDYAMWMLLADKGNIYKINEYMAVYRYGAGFWESKSNIERNIAMIKVLSKLSVICSENKTIIEQQLENIIKTLRLMIDKKDDEIIKVKTSISYRLSNVVMFPLRKIKQVLFLILKK